MGLECAGVIEEIGAGAGADWRVGDRVCALLASGAMAEEVVVDARHVLPVPEGLSLHEAAAIPEVYATAWLNIFQLGALKAGEKVLVHAGASGVGSAAIQLCKAFGSPVWVSVGSQDRLDYCQALGAAGGVVRNQNLDALEALGPFDVVLDPVGASYGALNLKVLARDGRWVIIGLMGGRQVEMDLAQVLGKRLQIAGQTPADHRFDPAQSRRCVQGRVAARVASAGLATVQRRATVAAIGRYLSGRVRRGGLPGA